MRPCPQGYIDHFHHAGLNIDVFVEPERRWAKGYAGRKAKPVFFLRFNDDAKMEAYLRRWIDERVASFNRTQEEKRHNRETPCPLKPGDVLCSSWGHEQTNVDAYQVIEVRGNRKVAIRPIHVEKAFSGTDTDRGYCLPFPDQFNNEPFFAFGNWRGEISLTRYSAAKPWPRLPDGRFRPLYWSSYA
jgi:hypothetical protein